MLVKINKTANSYIDASEIVGVLSVENEKKPGTAKTVVFLKGSPQPLDSDIEINELAKTINQAKRKP